MGLFTRLARAWIEPEAVLAEHAAPIRMLAEVPQLPSASALAGGESWQMEGQVVTLPWALQIDLPTWQPSGSEDWYLSADEAKSVTSMDELRLVRYADSGGDRTLRLQHRESQRMVSPTWPGLVGLGLYVENLRGENFRLEGNRKASTEPGRPLMLRREAANPHDPFAVAALDSEARVLLGYLGRRKARAVSRALTVPGDWVAISLRGTSAGVDCSSVQVLACGPTALAALLQKRRSPAIGG